MHVPGLFIRRGVICSGREAQAGASTGTCLGTRGARSGLAPAGDATRRDAAPIPEARVARAGTIARGALCLIAPVTSLELGAFR